MGKYERASHKKGPGETGRFVPRMTRPQGVPLATLGLLGRATNFRGPTLQNPLLLKRHHWPISTALDRQIAWLREMAGGRAIRRLEPEAARR